MSESSSFASEHARRRSDRALADLARNQHGVLTLAQITAAGLSDRAARHRAATGRLIRIHRGIYSVGPIASQEARWIAAVLACGAGAVLSHRSAATLWEIGDGRSGPVDVTVPQRTGRAHRGISVHGAATLDRADVTERDGVPVTTVARTLLDLAAVLDRRALERTIDRAESVRVFDLVAVRKVLERNPHRRGTRTLRSVLAAYSEPTVTRSYAEEQLLALIRSAVLPRPRVNAWIALPDGGGYEADFLWPKARLIVEIDGRAHHGTRRGFAHDRQRDRRLALAGFETRRYAAGELAEAPDRVIAEIRAFLGRPRS